MHAGQWIWIDDERVVGKLIEVETLWANTTYRVWLPSSGEIRTYSAEEIKPLAAHTAGFDAHHITYLTAAARIVDALNSDVLLAPLTASVIPLPHQLLALARAVSSDRVRYLLADEVGLGKTIEAGLILRELKLRRLVKRILVVTPKGLTVQWVSEMKTHFGEKFELVVPGDTRFGEDNIWEKHDQVICPIDSVKPLDSRVGWSRARVAEYNRQRYEDLIAAGWDLIIVDEAHRLGGSTDQVARYRLGQGLADAAPYLLLLSATPHQGKSEAFHRLISLLDPDMFPDLTSVSRERVRPYVIRTEKRHAVDAAGHTLFRPRHTQLEAVRWDSTGDSQRVLYDAVTDYVREGYNQALLEQRQYIGFLMILLQRLVTSSTWAIRASLEGRLEALQEQHSSVEQLPLFSEEFAELDGQEQFELLVAARSEAIRNERTEVEILLELANRAMAQGPDAKAMRLLELILQLQREEGDPELKFLIFTEFVPTQSMLAEFLTDRGYSVECLNGSLDLPSRQRVQERFADRSRILVSTDAGGEGLNLQFCHVVINYDIPWNPMRLEQRIGRVDRIGQQHEVRAFNFVLEDTVEHRVREVLENKLHVILEEFGVDKLGDVLDSADSARLFDDLYVNALVNPAMLGQRVDEVAQHLQHELESRQESVLRGADDTPEQQTGNSSEYSNRVPFWMERMTRNYILAKGGRIEVDSVPWSLRWPDGYKQDSVVFSSDDALLHPNTKVLTLEDDRIATILHESATFAPGQPIPRISIPSLSSKLSGLWSLWKLSLGHTPGARNAVYAVFVDDEGRVLIPAGRAVWERLLSEYAGIIDHLEGPEAVEIYHAMRAVAEERGREYFETLRNEHETYIQVERDKIAYGFHARRRAIDRLGLPEVRNFRLRQLAREEQKRLLALDELSVIHPTLQAYLIVRIG